MRRRAQLQGRGHQGALGRADAVDGAQLLKARPGTCRIRRCKQPPGHGHHVLAPGPAAEQHGHKFQIGQSLRPLTLELFARAIGDGDVGEFAHFHHLKISGKVTISR